jgi:site-specific recombinase XerD
LVIAACGSLERTGDLFEPYRLVDETGVVVAPVRVFLRELAAAGRSTATQRSYAMDLLRWFRFLWAVEVDWGQATRCEARDFVSWLRLADKPSRPHWRYPDGGAPGSTTAGAPAGTPNPVTGKPSPGLKYATATVLHCESVLRGFHEFHLEAGTGPMVNPFPLVRGGARANAHRNPMEPYVGGRVGRYRPRLASRLPRQIPDDLFDGLFARLGCDRDRALVAFWVSTGARASELLGAMVADADPGRQLVTVVRKGTRALQQLPASPDAFVWLRLYQARMHGLVPAGRDQPLWWTSRRPFRALTYDAARVMFRRANAALGANWSLHNLRHSAAYRMARDPDVPLTDVQWVLGHSHLSTTQRYLNPLPDDVIASVLAFHQQRRPAAGVPAAGYRPESLATLFGAEGS